ncbi:MAG: hypothetical protein LC667_12075 [Thioalkalivibrio sp.]|nr:hypothetical protein [Thioalkalivibrio sp.]
MSVELNTSSRVMFVGEVFSIHAIVRGENGAELQYREVIWTVTATTPAVRLERNVGQSNTIFALAPGVVSITASSGGEFVSIAVTVIAPPMTVAFLDPVLAPGGTLRVRGTGLLNATVSIANAPASVTFNSDTLLRILIPAGPFQPCIRGGEPLLAVVSAAHNSARASLVAAPVRLRMKLSAGAYSLATPAVRRGCEIQVEDAGTYVAMPFRLDQRDEGGNPNIDTLEAQLAVIPPGQSVLQAPRLQAMLARPERRNLPPDIIPPPYWLRGQVPPRNAPRMQTNAACQLPTKVGDSIQLFTDRQSDGTLPLGQPYSGRTEWWRLVDISNRLAVFVDTPAVRRLAVDPEFRQRIHAMVSTYETQQRAVP